MCLCVCVGGGGGGGGIVFVSETDIAVRSYCNSLTFFCYAMILNIAA